MKHSHPLAYGYEALTIAFRLPTAECIFELLFVFVCERKPTRSKSKAKIKLHSSYVAVEIRK